MNELFRDRVRERDLDNFLVEELHSSPEFLNWIVARLQQQFVMPSALKVFLQKSPPREADRRQTDVRIGWFDADTRIHACVLIESKITADFQPGQAEAYSSELAALRQKLGSMNAAAILMAPSAKLASLIHDGCFDAEIAVEEIVDFLRDRLLQDNSGEVKRRIEMRIQLLEALCGKRPSSGWVSTTIPEKRDFAESYALLALDIVPDLSVRPSTDGPKAITKIFDGVLIAGLPKFSIRHEFGTPPDEKYVNVQFGGLESRVPAVQSNGLLANTRYKVVKAGKSLAIRVATPGVDPMRPFEDERAKVEIGITAVRDMIIWLRATSNKLSEVLNPSSPEIEHAGTVPTQATFTEELMETYRQCERLGYKPTGMLQMIHDHGGIETARRLIASPLSDGFTRLTLLNRLDLTIESIVQREPWRNLFTDEELKRAAQRLR